MDNEAITTAEEAVETTEAVAEAPAAAPAKTATAARNSSNVNRGKRRKVCQFCADNIKYIDYKDISRLKKCCVSERAAKILPRRVSGTCAKHQRQVTVAIKRARTVALMPYVSGD